MHEVGGEGSSGQSFMFGPQQISEILGCCSVANKNLLLYRGVGFRESDVCLLKLLSRAEIRRRSPGSSSQKLRNSSLLLSGVTLRMLVDVLVRGLWSPLGLNT